MLGLLPVDRAIDQDSSEGRVPDVRGAVVASAIAIHLQVVARASIHRVSHTCLLETRGVRSTLSAAAALGGGSEITVDTVTAGNI